MAIAVVEVVRWGWPTLDVTIGRSAPIEVDAWRLVEFGGHPAIYLSGEEVCEGRNPGTMIVAPTEASRGLQVPAHLVRGDGQ